MRVISTEIAINASAERVWAVLSDNTRFPEWNPFITRCTGTIIPGARIEVELTAPGSRPMRFRPVVLVATPARELRWRGRVGLPGIFDGEHFFRIEDPGNGTVRFLHGEEFSGLLVPLFGGVIRRAREGFLRMNAALKARAERTET